MIFSTRSRACLHETSLLWLWTGNGCFLYAQHNFCSKNTIFISEAAVSSAFFCNVADRLDSHSVSGTLGRLENMIFLLYFPFKGIFHLDQEKVLMMKVNLCMDSPVERLCFQAGFQHFQEGWREPGTYRSGLWKCGLAELHLPGKECSPVLPERHNG